MDYSTTSRLPLKELRRMREVAAAAVPATDILGEVFGKR